MRGALALLLALMSSSIILAQPENFAVLIAEPASAQLNLTANEIGSLLILVSNLGSAAAENARLALVASGCVELLDEKGVWRSNLTLLLGNVTGGTAKRVFVPIRCRDGSGAVFITAFADNADPSLASVRVFARRGEQPQRWVWWAGALVVAALAIYAVRRKLRSGKSEASGRGKAASRVKRGEAGNAPASTLTHLT